MLTDGNCFLIVSIDHRSDCSIHASLVKMTNRADQIQIIV